MPIELSPHNPRIARVSDLRTPRGRRDARAFTAEGPTLLEEAERSGARPREIYATAAAARRIPPQYEAEGTPVYLIGERVFARLTDVETPTGILAVFDLPERTPAEILARPGVVLLLAGVGDPGNAGTLLRSAEAFGAAGVLAGHGGVDLFGPKVVRAAMGSLFRLPVATVDPGELLSLAEGSGRPILAADLTGDDVRETTIPENAILAVGNERHGVRGWLPRWDRVVRIPQHGPTESLNAAVAGSILLYEWARRHVTERT